MTEVEKNQAELTSPEKLKPSHQLDVFDCGIPSLNDWLKRRALRNEQEGASRTYVVCVENQVVGYYCLAAGAICCLDAPGRVRRNMPDPIPVVVIGRLAVHQNWQGQRLGRALLRDAVLRTLGAADVAGVRAILVHALSEDAKRFYSRCGFVESPTHPMTLVVMLKDIKASLGIE